MGGDGGQVIDRATMVKTKGWGLTKSGGGRYAASLGEMANYVQEIAEDRGVGFLERRRIRMTACLISQQTLKDPVVACRLGNLYNKEAVINALLNKNIPAQCGHIRALKDVKPLLLSWAESESEGGQKRMVCPVAREDLDTGGPRAVVIWPSGVVLSAKTLKEMKFKECPVTGKPFDPSLDVIPLVPDDEELQKLRDRLPAKKRKAATTADDAVGAGGAESKTAVAVSSEPSSAAATAKEDPKAKKAKKAATTDGKSEVFKSLLVSSRDGFTGTRDAFGTPAYNRGANIS